MSRSHSSRGRRRGVPEETFAVDTESPRRHTDRLGSVRDRQLCRQAAEALSTALACMPALSECDVWLADVVPAPDASRLCAIIVLRDSSQRAFVEELLERHSGALRSELAEAIVRKRAPELTFRLLEEP
ncbi:MAG: ribosome-binding factor A [Polyangiaceae bacterium]